jgi:hypothetical protein
LRRQLAWWRILDHSGLVTEFTRWVQRSPKLTAAMVQFAKDLEAAEIRAVLRYLDEMTGERS